MDTEREWLEADGLGGFASGTASGIRTRRYHALLLCATTPPTGRVVLVNGLEAWVETSQGIEPLTSHRYGAGVVHPDGATRITGFEAEPWPRWRFALAGGTTLEHEVVVPHGTPAVSLRWRALDAPPDGTLTLHVRLLVSGRDYHALHRENAAFRFEPDRTDGALTWRPYHGVPPVHAVSNGAYLHAPDWYRGFRYDAESARGLDDTEDLASPGVFTWDLRHGEAVLVLGAGDAGALTAVSVPDSAASASTEGADARSALAIADGVRASERRRRAAFVSPLHRAADAYVVARGHGRTIVAGYPWFTDWGRDTFIALRGLCLATGRLDDARQILLEWAGTVSDGMLPNRFPDRGDAPEFNSVDASLWFAIAVYELIEAAVRSGAPLEPGERRTLEEAVEAILLGCARGTRFGIRLDDDGLLRAGAPGVQLTWMDAKVGDDVITPRIGKPVEVEALWLNALWLAGRRSPHWRDVFETGAATFRRRFWNERAACLYDVVDVNHEAGTADGVCRPNQIFALGGLPVLLMDAARTRQALDTVERRLWTPLGLRSLAEDEPGYVPHYQGGVRERDGAYHQGTVWPWLLTAFVEAWVRSRDGRGAAIADARTRFLAPLVAHLDAAGLGHVSEIADGAAPHQPNGCPFQAWSVGELLRLDLHVLAEAGTPRNGIATAASNREKGASHAVDVR
jgi:predicted glycogen debranching enzyme